VQFGLAHGALEASSSRSLKSVGYLQQPVPVGVASDQEGEHSCAAVERFDSRASGTGTSVPPERKASPMVVPSAGLVKVVINPASISQIAEVAAT
jgi:hypothetical protein